MIGHLNEKKLNTKSKSLQKETLFWSLVFDKIRWRKIESVSYSWRCNTVKEILSGSIIISSLIKCRQ